MDFLDNPACKPKSQMESVCLAVDEMFSAFGESFSDLDDTAVWQSGLPGRHRIGTIILHVQQNIDQYGCCLQTGQWALDHEDRFDFYNKPVEMFLEFTNPPAAEVLRQRHAALRTAVLAGLAAATDRDLYSPRAARDHSWWQQHGRVSVDAYHRIVWHANAHLRQIWAIRGAIGAAGPEAFPTQYRH